LRPEGEKIFTIEQELESAQSHLKQTMSVLEAKIGEEVEGAEAAFSPENLLRNNLIGFSCIAGLLGYLIGSSQYRRMVGPIVLVGLGYGVWRRLATLEDDRIEDLDPS
jgi:hypothetical protein